MTARTRKRRGARLKAANADTREPNGRKSRRTTARKEREHEMEMNIMQPAIDARIRHYSLASKREGGEMVSASTQALDPRHGYVLGRLWLDRLITREQHDAGVKYGEDMARYYGLTGVRFPSARAQNLFAVRGEGGDASEEQADSARKARQRMAGLREHLLATGPIDTGRRVLHTINAVCVEDVEQARGWPDHMRAYLKKGLNALLRFYA